RGPVVAIAVVRLRGAKPEAALVRDPGHALGCRPALLDEPAPDHECREGVVRPGPALLRLLARAIDRPVRPHPVDRPDQPVAEVADVELMDALQGAPRGVGRDDLAHDS